MRAVLLDGQNSRHVGKRHKRPVLEPSAQKVEVGLLRVVVVGALAHDAVPLIDNNHELPAGLGVDVGEHVRQVPVVAKAQVTVLRKQIEQQQLLQVGKHRDNVVLRLGPKLLHVELEHVVAVALPVKRGVVNNGEPRELGRAVHRAVVVGTHHVGGHRLAEAARAAHAHVELFGAQDGVELRNEHALVHIGFRIAAAPQHRRPGVEKHAHVAPAFPSMVCIRGNHTPRPRRWPKSTSARTARPYALRPSCPLRPLAPSPAPGCTLPDLSACGPAPSGIVVRLRPTTAHVASRKEGQACPLSP